MNYVALAEMMLRLQGGAFIILGLLVCFVAWLGHRDKQGRHKGKTLNIRNPRKNMMCGIGVIVAGILIVIWPQSAGPIIGIAGVVVFGFFAYMVIDVFRPKRTDTPDGDH